MGPYVDQMWRPLVGSWIPNLHEIRPNLTYGSRDNAWKPLKPIMSPFSVKCRSSVTICSSKLKTLGMKLNTKFEWYLTYGSRDNACELLKPIMTKFSVKCRSSVTICSSDLKTLIWKLNTFFEWNPTDSSRDTAHKPFGSRKTNHDPVFSQN